METKKSRSQSRKAASDDDDDDDVGTANELDVLLS